jgi:hypothetical protein
MQDPEIYNLQRIRSVISRVRATGGLPPPQAQINQLSTWFRTLTTRGYVAVDFLSNADRVNSKLKGDFPNAMTRSQYLRAFLRYLTGLTDSEYETEFPNLDRRELVTLLQDLSRDANKERRNAETRL